MSVTPPGGNGHDEADRLFGIVGPGRGREREQDGERRSEKSHGPSLPGASAARQSIYFAPASPICRQSRTSVS